MTTDILQLSTSLTLGLFVGSLLTEGVILVPYWRSLRPEKFLKLHGTMGPQLFRYFAPLTVAATLIPVTTSVACYAAEVESRMYSAIVAFLMLAILGIFQVYFKGANASFASGSVGVEGLPAELQRWSNWHWLRTVMGIAAFALSLFALTK
jgi:hypothetical protein